MQKIIMFKKLKTLWANLKWLCRHKIEELGARKMNVPQTGVEPPQQYKQPNVKNI